MVASAAANLSQGQEKPHDWMARELKDLRQQIADLRKLSPSSLYTRVPGSTNVDVAVFADQTLKWVDGSPFVWVVFNQDGNRIFQTFPVAYADAPTNHVVSKATWGLYNPTDNANNEISPDALSGWGLAKPWISLPMYPQFVPVVPGTASNGAAIGYYQISSSASGMSQGVTLWHGRIPMVTHPKLQLNFLGGQASGAITPTYSLWVNLVQVDSWTAPGGFGSSSRQVDLTAVKHFVDVPVDIKVNWTGSGVIAASVDNCYLRGS